MARRRYDTLIHEPCGVPRDLGFDSDNEGWFVVEDDDLICYACQALEDRRREREQNKEKLESGAQVYVRLQGAEERKKLRGG